MFFRRPSGSLEGRRKMKHSPNRGSRAGFTRCYLSRRLTSPVTGCQSHRLVPRQSESSLVSPQRKVRTMTVTSWLQSQWMPLKPSISTYVKHCNLFEGSLRLHMFLLLIGFVLGCGDRQPAGDLGRSANDGLRMLPVFDLTLRESDTLFIADLVDLEVFHGDGSFFVADRFAGRVVRFDRTGTPTQLYGRKGSGPGELMRPGLPILFWDSLLVVGDRGSLALFRLDDGSFLRRTEPLVGVVSSGQIIDGEAWIGVHNYSEGTALAVLSSPTAKPEYLFALPREHLMEPRLQIQYLTSVAHLDSFIVVGISGNRNLWITDRQGTRIDSLVVPRAARRGVPADIADVLGRVKSDAEAMEAVSTLYSLSALPGGALASVYNDIDVVDYQQLILGARIYVSVLSPGLKSACVDYLVAEAPEDRPRHAWNGDTLFITSREIRDTVATTRIQGFKVDISECNWTPID